MTGQRLQSVSATGRPIPSPIRSVTAGSTACPTARHFRYWLPSGDLFRPGERVYVLAVHPTQEQGPSVPNVVVAPSLALTLAVSVRPPRPELPDLTGLQARQILDLTLNLLLGNEPPVVRSPENSQLYVNFVRLADKTVHEYESARQACKTYRDTPAERNLLGPYWQAVDDIEGCINALYRALLYLGRLRKNGVVLDRTDTKLLCETALKSLKSVRDAIEHTDEHISKNGVPSGCTPWLVLEKEHLEIEGHQLTYASLAGWIVRTSETARRLGTVASPSEAG
jgi:hypothetical protein